MKIKKNRIRSIPVFSYVMDIFLFSHPLQLLITQHSLVQFFLHPVNEIGAAFVLPAFDISVEAVAVFRINPEYLIEKWGELFERHIAVVDAAHHVYAVDKFHEVDGIARPLKKLAVVSVALLADISGGTWGVARNFCIFLTKDRALLT